jgi:hypothetical protein
MADDTEEYMKMNDAYKGRIVNVLRSGPMEREVTMRKPPPPAAPPPEAKPAKKQLYPGDTVKSAIGDAYDKYLGPKNPLEE